MGSPKKLAELGYSNVMVGQMESPIIGSPEFEDLSMIDMGRGCPTSAHPTKEEEPNPKIDDEGCRSILL